VSGFKDFSVMLSVKPMPRRLIRGGFIGCRIGVNCTSM